ncbi:TetR/AcrR family transcriptional regulator [Lentzea sp. HUAS12]|uniref:TetR/AcrR family transcriptional regulator n=1 Tax=Lentzea sp. HUAS12 TaxID=2951806 RepID=UPI0020A12570|nr:TetR/AcrR family transcriptional regulator [Lentzea sp. HUAS12]USX53486.1 TetR/AcrR family transcriptional regulator [Lentzea sp. HUAS12]
MARQETTNLSSSPVRRRGGRKPTISREQILRAAGKFAPEELSIPALAGSLGVTHAGIYHYFSSRAELVAAIAAHASRQLEPPPPGPWEDWLVEVAFVLRGHFSQFASTADLAAIGTSVTFAPLVEALLRVMRDAGFTIRQAGDASELIASCALGGAVVLQRPNFDAAALVEDLQVAEDSPVHELAASAVDDDADAAFRRRLAVVVAGLKASLEAPTAS